MHTWHVGACLLAASALAAPEHGQLDAFVYQGRLKMEGSLADGACDFLFELWKDPQSTDPDDLLGTIFSDAVMVNKGLFSVELDFGPLAFDGNPRWLAIKVACPSGSQDFVSVSPRQEIASAPYAAHARAPWVLDPADGSLSYEAGQVGVGTTDPEALLDVRGVVWADGGGLWVDRSPTLTIGRDDSEKNFVFDLSGPGVEGYGIRLGRNPNNPPPLTDVFIPGDLVVGGSCSGCSDLRLKADLEPIGGALDAVHAIRGIRFTWRADLEQTAGLGRARQVGVVAQELRQVLPEAVREGRDGMLAVDYGRITPLLIEAIKELHATSIEHADAAAARQRGLEGQLAEQRRIIRAQVEAITVLTERLARLEASLEP